MFLFSRAFTEDGGSHVSGSQSSINGVPRLTISLSWEPPPSYDISIIANPRMQTLDIVELPAYSAQRPPKYSLHPEGHPLYKILQPEDEMRQIRSSLGHVGTSTERQGHSSCGSNTPPLRMSEIDHDNLELARINGHSSQEQIVERSQRDSESEDDDEDRSQPVQSISVVTSGYIEDMVPVHRSRADSLSQSEGEEQETDRGHHQNHTRQLQPGMGGRALSRSSCDLARQLHPGIGGRALSRSSGEPARQLQPVMGGRPLSMSSGDLARQLQPGMGGRALSRSSGDLARQLQSGMGGRPLSMSSGDLARQLQPRMGGRALSRSSGDLTRQSQPRMGQRALSRSSGNLASRVPLTVYTHRSAHSHMETDV